MLAFIGGYLAVFYGIPLALFAGIIGIIGYLCYLLFLIPWSAFKFFYYMPNMYIAIYAVLIILIGHYLNKIDNLKKLEDMKKDG